MFVDLGIQHEVRMRSITFLTVTCLAVPHFPTLSHKLQEFFFFGGGGLY